MDERKTIDLQLSDYTQKGLYLILKDSSRISLTRENIENAAFEYWNNPDKIPSSVKTAVEFQRCPFCPLKGKDDLCDAIRPVLPFLGIIDKYVSFDNVTAVYKEDEKDVLQLADTTMQEALKYVSLLSLMQYCQVGRKYWKYYFGITPLKGGKEAAIRIYLNMYWLHSGKKKGTAKVASAFREEVDKAISNFVGQIRVTSQNQVKRLNLICKNDAFMNAFVNTQIAAEFLSMDIEKMLAKAFDEFEKNIVHDPQKKLKADD